MRQLSPPEIEQRHDEIVAMATRIRQRVHQSPEPEEVFTQVLEGKVHAWEHEGIVVYAGCYIEDGRTIARIHWASGALPRILQWYDAWEAECLRCGVNEIRIGGRYGWLGLSRKLKRGFVYESGFEMVKRLN